MSVLPIALLWFAAGAPAGGTIRIAVTDAATGRSVAGATVVLADVARTGVADTDGRYAFTDVAPGPHHLAVRRLGYAPRVLHAFVGEEQALDLTIALTPLPSRLAGVRVESAPTLPMRDHEARPVDAGDRALTLAAVRNHPLLAEPDGQLAVVGGHVTARPESPSGLHVFGGAADHLAYLVDGIPVLSPYHGSGTFGVLNPDALDRVELRVQPGGTPPVDALGGVLSASTRAVPARSQLAGGLSATQSRLTLEAPLPGAGAGLLLSGRLLFPGLLGQKREPAHIDGDGSDALGRLVTSLGGGTLRLVAVRARNDVSIASRVPATDTSHPPARSDLRWSSTSLGAHWERQGDSGAQSLALWRAAAGADATWLGDSVPIVLSSGLVDISLLAQARRETERGTLSVAARVTRRTGHYRAAMASVASGTPGMEGRTSLVTVHPQWARRSGTAGRLTLGGTAAGYRGRVLAAPFAEWTWNPAIGLSLSAFAGRRLQFTQSVRNPESPIGNVFPADLPLPAGSTVPVARSDQVMLMTAWRPTPARLLGVRAWARRLGGLVLPAIGTDGPFVTAGLATGGGRARGLSIDASAAGARWGAMANYGVQRVRFTAGDTTWQPEHGTTHTVDAGVIAFPIASASVRAGLSVGAGRRVSGFSGQFEWEACNLRDRGCEFAGGPFNRDEPLGTLALPRYARLDLGARQHWHVRAAGRDVVLAAFASWSNLLGTRNVLTFVRDPVTGLRQPAVMRPSAPLVIGLDWSF